MNKDQYNRMTNDPGFIAALDQSGGSTPKALKLYGINEDAYANWIFKIKPNNPSDYDGLLSAADYEAQA